MRRSHDHLTFTEAVEICEHCGETHLRHRVCAKCGFYRGRPVLAIVAEA